MGLKQANIIYSTGSVRQRLVVELTYEGREKHKEVKQHVLVFVVEAKQMNNVLPLQENETTQQPLCCTVVLNIQLIVL